MPVWACKPTQPKAASPEFMLFLAREELAPGKPRELAVGAVVTNGAVTTPKIPLN